MIQKVKPLISIIIPCYNSEEYLSRCIDSILANSFNCAEIVLVNDGSTDNTPFIIENYNSPFITVINKENGGYCSAVNRGIDEARGDYIMFLGSDDCLAHDILLSLKEEINKNNPDVILFKTVKKDSLTNSILYDVSQEIKNYRYHKGDMGSFVYLYPSESKLLFYRDTSKCYKTSLVGEIRYYGKRGIASDDIFSTYVCSRAQSFSFLNVDGYIWNVRPDSISCKKNSREKYKEIVSVYNEFFSLNPSICFDYRLSKQIYAFLDSWARCLNGYLRRSFFKTRLYRKSKQLLIKSISSSCLDDNQKKSIFYLINHPLIIYLKKI